MKFKSLIKMTSKFKIQNRESWKTQEEENLVLKKNKRNKRNCKLI